MRTSNLNTCLLSGALAVLLLTACTGKPLIPYSADTAPMVLLPATQAGVADDRARFREIFCAVMEDHGQDLPDYRSCEEALVRVGDEPQPGGLPVDLGPTQGDFLIGVVPGLGSDCFEKWLESESTGLKHVTQFGYEAFMLDVDGLSSSAKNARQIRDIVTALPEEESNRPIILVGYSKGAPDILRTVVDYPEVSERVVAVVSIAGAVGGSPLANPAKQSQANMLINVPGATCDKGDGGAIESLRPKTRKNWLAKNMLPKHIKYYSVVSYPEPDRVSSGLKSNYRKLGEIDSRNDGSVIFYDQIIPGSTIIAFANADHFAIVIPIARSHEFLSATIINKNDFPREVLFEALLRYVEEDLANQPGGVSH
jgi:pimeloyl-ACP methyl ester carboxylesterase